MEITIQPISETVGFAELNGKKYKMLIWNFDVPCCKSIGGKEMHCTIRIQNDQTQEKVEMLLLERALTDKECQENIHDFFVNPSKWIPESSIEN